MNESIAAAAAPATVLPPSVIYWDSTDARKLFGALPEDENVITTLEQKISKLKASNQTAEGYQDVIEGRDPQDACCTPNQIYEIRQRCAILCMAYIFAKEQMNDGITWESCCRQSCLHLNVCGIRQITDWNVLE